MGKKNKHAKPARTTDIEPSVTASHLTAFSPDLPVSLVSKSSEEGSAARTRPTYYAQVTRAPDAHTLRIFSSSSGKCVHRWTSSSADSSAASAGASNGSSSKVSSIAWAWLPAKSASQQNLDTSDLDEPAESEAKRGKKRRKSDGAASLVDQSREEDAETVEPKLTLCVGLENGSVYMVAPNGSRSKVISHSSCSSPVVALRSCVAGSTAHLWTAHSDGILRVWDLRTESLICRSKPMSGTGALNDIDVRYTKSASSKMKHFEATVLAAREAIDILVAVVAPSKKGKVREIELRQASQCSGHVERSFVRWVDAGVFVSWCHADRHVQVWTAQNAGEGESATRANLIARLTLDSPSKSVTTSDHLLAAVDTQGTIAVTSLPEELSAGSKIVSLPVQSKATAGASDKPVDFRFVSDSTLLISFGVVNRTFVKQTVRDDNGHFLPKVQISDASRSLVNGNKADHGIDVVPYSEHKASAVPAFPQASKKAGEQSDDESDEDEMLGQLDVDSAEPTLAERLKALNVESSSSKKLTNGLVNGTPAAGEMDADDDEDVEVRAVPATTLTTTLIQALHSTDAPLLESCLAQTKPELIRATVKRLPPGSLVLNLLEAIVERLGKGKKGAQRNASVERSRGLIEWLRQVLMIHVSFLVTIPSLVQRLAALHTALTARLELQPRLLALNGRLELVVSQIDARRETRTVVRDRERTAGKGRVYVEGESDSSEEEDEEMANGAKDDSDDETDDEEDDEEDADEDDDDEGSVEDIALGDDASDFDEDGSDEDGPGALVDLEASEGEEEDEDMDGDDGLDFEEDEDVDDDDVDVDSPDEE